MLSGIHKVLDTKKPKETRETSEQWKTVTQFRDNGVVGLFAPGGKTMMYTTHYNSPIGNILLAERDGGLIGLWIEGQKYYFGSGNDTITENETPILAQTKNWLDRYFAGEKPEIRELTLAPIGGDFRQSVWKILCEIPYGETTTYGEIARKMAATMGKEKMSAQAVGGAVGHNQISIIIPCHRVVGTNGSLTGYAGGLATKMKLLTHEGVNMERLFIPKKRTDTMSASVRPYPPGSTETE